MINTIPTGELRIGLSVHDLDCKWLESPFLISKFTLKNAQRVRKIASAGIRHVYIAVRQGRDVDAVPTAAEVESGAFL